MDKGAIRVQPAPNSSHMNLSTHLVIQAFNVRITGISFQAYKSQANSSHINLSTHLDVEVSEIKAAEYYVMMFSCLD